jgi:molybdopterin converting factor subunit 1
VKVKTLFFGVARDIVGKDELLIDVQGNSTIQEFEMRLLDQYPDFTDIRNFAFAVNESYADRNYRIQKNDLIAVLPPVSGG